MTVLVAAVTDSQEKQVSQHLCKSLMVIVLVPQDGQAAAHGAEQLPQHQQQLHGHAAPLGAAAATASAGATAGSNGSQAANSGTSQQAAGSGSTAAGSGTGTSAQGSSSGQGSGDGSDPNRNNHGSTGHANAAGGQSSTQQQQQGSVNQQQNAQPGQMPFSGAWAAANYGYVWNMPQWVPATSMALFAPAMGYHPMQYAGQTNPASVAPELQVGANTMLFTSAQDSLNCKQCNQGVFMIPVNWLYSQGQHNHQLCLNLLDNRNIVSYCTCAIFRQACTFLNVQHVLKHVGHSAQSDQHAFLLYRGRSTCYLCSR